MTKVILVDNNKDVCSIYADTLRCAGYQVECLNSEVQAVEKICKEQPDLVLLDVLMPKISGLHMLQMIMQDPCHVKTKVAMLTDLSDSTIRDKAIRGGAVDYIIKSETRISELLKRVDRAIS